MRYRPIIARRQRSSCMDGCLCDARTAPPPAIVVDAKIPAPPLQPTSRPSSSPAQARQRRRAVRHRADPVLLRRRAAVQWRRRRRRPAATGRQCVGRRAGDRVRQRLACRIHAGGPVVDPAVGHRPPRLDRRLPRRRAASPSTPQAPRSPPGRRCRTRSVPPTAMRCAPQAPPVRRGTRVLVQVGPRPRRSGLRDLSGPTGPWVARALRPNCRALGRNARHGFGP